MGFLSTLSLRRATGNDRRGCWYSCYFYPRSPYGERRMSRCTVAGSCRFLSTLSLRRATTKHDQATNTHRISIHALLTESDRPSAMLSSGREYFYPRSPCGERPALSLPFGAVWIISIHALLAESDRPNHGKRNKKVKFLSTLSLRRATKAHPQSHFQLLFLSTLSLRRATT